MKRRSIIGLSVGVLVFSVLFGIASLPDGVLESSTSVAAENAELEVNELQVTETPQEVALGPPIQESLENAQEISELKKEILALQAEIDSVKANEAQVLSQEVTEPEVQQVEEQPDQEPEQTEDSEGKVIRVGLNDGVGTSMR